MVLAVNYGHKMQKKKALSVFKRILKIPGTGALRKGFAMIPNRYKILGGLALTTYALTRPKDTAAVKTGKITYKKVEKPLGFLFVP